MTDKQQPILVLGKEYFPNPAPLGGCDGCVGFDNSELCEALPLCHRTIFVERKPGEYRDLNGKVMPTPLIEVSRLCDEARADGYAKGMAAKQAEWDKWQADRAAAKASWMEKYPTLARTAYPATSYKSAQEVSRKADSASVLDPSGAAGICGVARTYGPATSHKAARSMGRKAGRVADLILVELRDANLTGSMLAERTGVALNSITPRFAQLFRAGLIHAAGGSGRETVWAIGNGIHVAPLPDAPVLHWCVGCTPDNCAGCDGSAASNVATA